MQTYTKGIHLEVYIYKKIQYCILKFNAYIYTHIYPAVEAY